MSFVLPARNERDSLPALVREIRDVGATLARPIEIVVVDDASDDDTGPWLEEESRAAEDLVAVRLSDRAGQSRALAAGIAASRGDVLVTLDADLQNDPADVPRLLARLADCDLVCGVRVERHDTLSKRLGSRVANGVRRFVLRDPFRDVGCALRAWRRDVAERVPKFDGFHRFIPVLAASLGYRVVEVDVNHRARKFGRTHYGQIGRALRASCDLWRVRRLMRSHRSP